MRGRNCTAEVALMSFSLLITVNSKHRVWCSCLLLHLLCVSGVPEPSATKLPQEALHSAFAGTDRSPRAGRSFLSFASVV